MKVSILLATLVTFVRSEVIRFENYKLFKVFVESEKQFQILKDLQKDEWITLNIWNDVRKIGDSFDIMVPPGIVSDFEGFLNSAKVRYKLTIPNVQSVIESQRTSATDAFNWTRYNTLQEIESWLDEVSAQNRDVMTVATIGKSVEERAIKALKISYKEGNKGIFIDSNIHANEWISSAAITWMINELIHSNDPYVRDIAENLDWHIIPVVNVDGLVYTHEVDRTWRKNRNPHTSNCTGTDMNRNFDFKWSEAGSSDDPCSKYYAGAYGASEPEVASVVEYFNSLPNDYIKIYAAIHSYGQFVLTPYGHTDTEFPPNYDEMIAIAEAFAAAVLPLNRTLYEHGSSATTYNFASGSSKDWAYGVKKINISYTIELPDRGDYGFLLPPEKIIPTAEEMLSGFVGMVKEARARNILPSGVRRASLHWLLFCFSFLFIILNS